jgi:hypothetical protein
MKFRAPRMGVAIKISERIERNLASGNNRDAME